MLKGTKSISMNFNSIIDGKTAVYMSASIPENGRSSHSVTIQDQDLYDANKDQCRSDIEEFEKLLYAAEDEQTKYASSADDQKTETQE